MAATKTFLALTTIAVTFGPGKLRILDKSTIDIFDEAMILAADTIMPGRNRGVALVMSPAEWNALPENDLENGNFRPQPLRPPDIPDRPIPLGFFAPAGDVRAYDPLCSVREDAILDDANMTAAIIALTEIYKNPAIVGERNAKIAIGNGDMMARRLNKCGHDCSLTWGHPTNPHLWSGVNSTILHPRTWTFPNGYSSKPLLTSNQTN
jgi:hypothetical protein